MEDSKTKYIESSLAAFRAIKTFVFIKGFIQGFSILDSGIKRIIMIQS